MASKKRRLEEDKDSALERLVASVNELIEKRPWYVCTHCNRLVLGEGDYMPTTKWGETAIFCSRCIRTCQGCKERYVDSLYYQHDDCERESSSSSADE